MKSFLKKFMVACVLLPMSLGLGLSTTACTEDSVTTTQSDGYSVIKQTDNYVLHKIVKRNFNSTYYYKCGKYINHWNKSDYYYLHGPYSDDYPKRVESYNYGDLDEMAEDFVEYNKVCPVCFPDGDPAEEKE